MKIVERFTRTERRRAAVRDHDRRSEDLHAAVHDLAAADLAARLPAAALRVPRRQLHAAERRSSGERAEDKALEEDAKKGIIRPRKGVQQGLDAGARPIPRTPGGEGGPGR